MKPIVSQVCDRLNCHIDSCYGWELCKEARKEATIMEWRDLKWAINVGLYLSAQEKELACLTANSAQREKP